MKVTTWAVILILGIAVMGCGGDSDTEALEAQLATLQGQLATLQDQLADAEAAEALADSTIASLQTSLDAAEAMLADAQADLTASESTVADLNTQVATLQGQLDAIETVLAGIAGTVTLELPFVFGDDSLELDTVYPIPGSSDSASFSEVRYWVSNVALLRADGSAYEVPDSYYLVEVRGDQQFVELTDVPLDLPARRRESIVLAGVPAGVYTGVRFHVGIDPARNDNFANYAGELHVLQNMVDVSWMWLTSYVFTKTRGTVSGASDVSFAWDNGTNADYREVEFDDLGTDATVSVQNPWRIEVAADLASLVSEISPRSTPSIGAGSAANRALLADGFVDMFSLVASELDAP